MSITAYEFLGRRFDAKTRLLGAALFLLQRGLAAGITIYAPAIILSTMLGWRLDLTIILSGLLVIIYTVIGGSEAVSLTQKYQMAVIFGGMMTAFIVLLVKLPAESHRRPHGGGRFSETGGGGFFVRCQTALHLLVRPAGRTLSVAFVLRHRSIPGATLYFGDFFARKPARADVQCRAQNPHAVLHPAAGRLVFVFYQFEQPPVFFNQVGLAHHAVNHGSGAQLHSLEQKFAAIHVEKKQWIQAWLDARHAGNPEAEAQARAQALAADGRSEAVRAEARTALLAAEPGAKSNDSDYVFITFILALPAAWGHRPAGGGVFRRRAVVEGRRTQRAGVNDHH